MEIIKTKEEADHVQFLITEQSGPGIVLSTELAETETQSLDPKVSPATFCKVFPFHIMFDRNMNIIQTGTTVARVMPKVTEPNCKITDILDTVRTYSQELRIFYQPKTLFQVRPHLDLTFDNVLSHINTVYVLRTRPGVMEVDVEPEYSSMRLKVRT